MDGQKCPLGTLLNKKQKTDNAEIINSVEDIKTVSTDNY